MAQVHTVHVIVPFWGLAGGVIKVLDYAEHAHASGRPVTLWAPPLPAANDDLIYQLPVAQRLLAASGVKVRDLEQISSPSVGADDVVLISEPGHHQFLERAGVLPLGERLIHLVQGTRHANPSWQDGFYYRLLHRPMTRVAVSPQVFDAVSSLVNQRHGLHLILEGHDASYFTRETNAATVKQPPRLRVLYATWKSDLGDRVAEILSANEQFAFVAVRGPLGWPGLRNRYHGADLFLCAPGPEEGFYLPGLEAMAAGLGVVTAVVGGNECYVEHEANALVVPYDDSLSHANALIRLAEEPELRAKFAKRCAETVANHTIERERREFTSLLENL